MECYSQSRSVGGRCRNPRCRGQPALKTQWAGWTEVGWHVSQLLACQGTSRRMANCDCMITSIVA
eukprot:3503880-Rhodomonas_salina.1